MIASPSEASVLHADLDAFYASVEQLLDPDLRGRPVAVGGGVVLAASYEARAFGVHAAMPGRRARQLCPGLRIVPGHFREYQRLGDAVVAMFHDVTPEVERISIDEAFLDVAGARRLLGPAPVIAAELRRRVRDELGLPLSIGVARTKHLAKVASQVAKPDGLVVVPAGTEAAFLDPLPVGLLWGVGPVTRAALAGRGIHTVGQLAAASGGALRDLLGQSAGTTLADLAADRDPRRVGPARRARSVGAQHAFRCQSVTPGLLTTTVAWLADRVAGRLRAGGRAGHCVTVRVRFEHARTVSRSVTLGQPVASTLTIRDLAADLAVAALDPPGPISLIGLSIGQLVDGSAPLQLELPFAGVAGHGDVSNLDARRPGSVPGVARRRLDGAVDAVRSRFGRDALGWAAGAPGGGVDDAFRELAERAL